MRVTSISLRLVKLPLVKPFSNRWERFESWTKLIVQVTNEDGLSGWGECTAMETPYYNSETIDTAWLLIEKFLSPRLLGKELAAPTDVATSFSDICGNEEARGALEVACWDLFARSRNVPLFQLIGGQAREVESGATIGVEDDAAKLLAAVQVAVDAGYSRIKLKVKPGWDLEPLSVIRRAHAKLKIVADANGSYSPADLDKLLALDRFELLFLEQPFGIHHWPSFARLQARMGTPLCLDESIKCVADVEQLLELKAARAVNIKLGRVGGMAESLRIYRRCRDEGLGIFIGAKYESGIGRWTNIALATLPNVAFPSDVAASDRYFRTDTVIDPVRLVAPGRVAPLSGAGFGSNVDFAEMDKQTTCLKRLELQ